MRLKPFSLIGVVALGACSTISGPYGGGGENYASASILGEALPSSDASALRPVFVHAIEAGKDGERFDWRGSSAFGWVKARETRVGNLKADPYDRPVVPDGLVLEDQFETEQGLYALTSNANVRLGPATSYPVLKKLESGTGLTVIGKVVGKPWMLVEEGAAVAGYVHDSLMIKAPGTELELAGGPQKSAVLCRSYEQRISYGGRSDLWTGVACNEGGRWVIDPASQNQPTQLL